MAYAERFVYLTVKGSFGPAATTVLEEWQAGFKFRHPDAPPTPAQLVAFLESAATPVANFHGNSSVNAGTNCYLKELNVAYIDTDGKYVGGAAQVTTKRPYPTPVAGQGTTTYPYTQALVISLRTVLTRGPGSNGRVYWPVTGMGIAGGTGTVASVPLSSFADAAQTLINALNAAKVAQMPGTGGLAVMSQVGAGIAATVTSIRVGAKMDRQERRERDIPEGYVTRGVTVVGLADIDRSNRPIGT